jgi:hypothetical protein
LVSLTVSLFSEKILIFKRCINGLMSNLIKKSWTVSTTEVMQLKKGGHVTGATKHLHLMPGNRNILLWNMGVVANLLVIFAVVKCRQKAA